MKSHTLDRILHPDAPVGKLARGETSVTRMLLRRLMRNPLRSAGVVTMAAAGLVIFMNIMLMQPERHRAPVFVGNPMIHATPQPAQVTLPPLRPGNLIRESELAQKAELTKDLQIELARRGFFLGEPDPLALNKTTQAIRDFQSAAKLPIDAQVSEATLAAVLTSNIRARDQILSVINASSDRLERPDTVVAIQRSLTKLGYGPLRDDGHMGPGTRAALDKFERDRKLPPRGDAPARVLRELSQSAGIAID
jgi:peptidoglycan hydrolase-like protein with peptidoglycan-binding domain